ncbi:uncharacterized protein LOC143183270 [Calliopsis andreniformis]|uniref:uncharacterized protein LOC143183270 n=1 Tax=Calliopsis andreniformis TaxID=337506 RepID=UPI003FCE1F0C
MTKEKGDSKLLLLKNVDKNINVKSKNKHLNVRKKGKYNSLQHCQETCVKQRIKKECIKKTDKILTKSDVSNITSKCNEEIYEHQIQQLNLILKQSLNSPTLTQDELKILFIKYKLDGHYRINKNLPPFTSLISSMNGAINEERHIYNEIKHSALSNAQKVNSKNNKDIVENLYCDTNNENQCTETNLHMFKNIQLSLKHNPWKPKKILKENIHNTIGDYNHTITNCDIQTYGNANVFNCTQNFGQSKSSSAVNEIFNAEDEQLLCNVTNVQTIHSEERQNYGCINKNILYNLPDLTVENEDLSDYSEMSQQNGVQYTVINRNDLSLNSNFCNDIHSNKWNNNVSWINNNNHFQSWRNVESLCTPCTNTLESHYNVKNSSSPSQLTLIKGHSEEQNNFNSHVHTNVRLMDSEYMPYVTNSSSTVVQQDFNNYYTSVSTVTSDNLLSPETDMFIPALINTTNQHV